MLESLNQDGPCELPSDNNFDDLANNFEYELNQQNWVSILHKVNKCRDDVDQIITYFNLNFFEGKVKSGELRPWADALLVQIMIYTKTINKLSHRFDQLNKKDKDLEKSGITGQSSYLDESGPNLGEIVKENIFGISRGIRYMKSKLEEVKKKLKRALKK